MVLTQCFTHLNYKKIYKKALVAEIAIWEPMGLDALCETHLDKFFKNM